MKQCLFYLKRGTFLTAHGTALSGQSTPPLLLLPTHCGHCVVNFYGTKTLVFLCIFIFNNLNLDDKNGIVMYPRQSDQLVHRKQTFFILHDVMTKDDH